MLTWILEKETDLKHFEDLVKREFGSLKNFLVEIDKTFREVFEAFKLELQKRDKEAISLKEELESLINELRLNLMQGAFGSMHEKLSGVFPADFVLKKYDGLFEPAEFFRRTGPIWIDFEANRICTKPLKEKVNKIIQLITSDSNKVILLCGPRGSGKSTLIRYISYCLYDSEFSGKIWFVYPSIVEYATGLLISCMKFLKNHVLIIEDAQVVSEPSKIVAVALAATKEGVRLIIVSRLRKGKHLAEKFREKGIEFGYIEIENDLVRELAEEIVELYGQFEDISYEILEKIKTKIAWKISDLWHLATALKYHITSLEDLAPAVVKEYEAELGRLYGKPSDIENSMYLLLALATVQTISRVEYIERKTIDEILSRVLGPSTAKSCMDMIPRLAFDEFIEESPLRIRMHESLAELLYLGGERTKWKEFIEKIKRLLIPLVYYEIRMTDGHEEFEFDLYPGQLAIIGKATRNHVEKEILPTQIIVLMKDLRTGEEKELVTELRSAYITRLPPDKKGHVAFLVDENGILKVFDLGSTNKTAVNGEILKPDPEMKTGKEIKERAKIKLVPELKLGEGAIEINIARKVRRTHVA